MVLLDLQARIASELRPDYLLIDARTGVTELGGLATTVLADTVVCLFVGNQESLDGTLTVVEALKAAPRLANQEQIQVVPVLSRTTAKVAESDRFATGVKRLTELGVATKSGQSQNQNELVLFSLPHDEVLGASERLVAGESKASTFSPLYKAYLELFQRLFPSGADRAKRVLERLEAVAEVREHLTTGRSTAPGFRDVLSPWNLALIQEGVLYKGEESRGKETRYADLVCRNENSQPLMVVEYVGDGERDAALEFWSRYTRLRCVVLLVKDQYRRSREIFTRDIDGKLHKTERRDLPRPREFELLRDVGDRSIEAMLDAVRHGHVEAVAWLINEWQDSALMAAGMHPIRGPGHWRPERAQRVLDGLAATEDLNCAEEILRRATPKRSDLLLRERRFRDDWEFDEELQEKMGEDLFAPLFWRLPVEAALNSMQERRYPGDIGSLAGYRLIAENLMGLRYDPDRGAIEDAREISSRLHVPRDDRGENELMWVHRSRRELAARVSLSDEAPPALIWEAMLEEHPYDHVTLEEAKGRVGPKVRELLDSSTGLRRRLREISGRRELATQGLLGSYEPSGRIELYQRVIAAVAEILGVSPRFLKSVVFIHLSTWAMARESYDLDGQRGFGFTSSPRVSPFPLSRESPTHVTLVQAFTDRLIRLLRDPNLEAAFEKLSTQQPDPYARWLPMRDMPAEKLRMLLLIARANAAALGLPSSGENKPA